MSERCADCGREITRRRNGWAHIRPDGMEDYACRWDLDQTDDEFVVNSIDYHYVEGEEQRTFRRPEA